MNAEIHRDVGAYVLGALDADARAEFEHHLDACEQCRNELVDLVPLPGLMAAVDFEELPIADPTSVSDVVAVASRQFGAIERSRRRWRGASVGLAAAAAVAVVLFIGERADPVPAGDLVGDIELAITSTEPIDGRIAFDERRWGTRLELDLAGLPSRDGYEVWVVTGDGAWELAASFGPIDTSSCRIIGSTKMRPDDIAMVVVTTTDRTEELVWATQP